MQISVNNKQVSVFPKLFAYPFFLVHMGMFGVSGFMMAYSNPPAPLLFIYLHGGIAIFVYCIFYIGVFGFDTVKWMFLNAVLSIFGIFSQMGYLVKHAFGRNISSYPIFLHLTPILYFVLYTFLLRQMVIDIFGARNNPHRLYVLNNLYVIVLIAFYVLTYYFRTRWN